MALFVFSELEFLVGSNSTPEVWGCCSIESLQCCCWEFWNLSDCWFCLWNLFYVICSSHSPWTLYGFPFVTSVLKFYSDMHGCGPLGFWKFMFLNFWGIILILCWLLLPIFLFFIWSSCYLDVELAEPIYNVFFFFWPGFPIFYVSALFSGRFFSNLTFWYFVFFIFVYPVFKYLKVFFFKNAILSLLRLLEMFYIVIWTVII